MIKQFIQTLKDYIDYLMKVDYKELFINTVIIFCIVVLSLFVYVPIGLVRDLLNSIIQVFGSISNIFSLIFTWIFNLISLIGALMAFMYMFNKRFENIKNKQVKVDVTVENKNTNIEEKEEVELPKVKD